MISVFKVFRDSLMWVVWGSCYPTPQNESTAQQWSQSGYKFFCYLKWYSVSYWQFMNVKVNMFYRYSKFLTVPTVQVE